MASVQATALLTSVVTKNGNTSAFLPPGFSSASSAECKEFCARSLASGVRATLTFDPQTTMQKKRTVDPSSPDFLPLPSFEHCFSKSTKEYRLTWSETVVFELLLFGIERRECVLLSASVSALNREEVLNQIRWESELNKNPRR
ncbi:unnamed protein product [Dovyalis caffra]|uniref:Uncharacterized protein n=1 Tax=Dovyalis caffra TaxID=77055 RepID=A0AAV1R3A5_9ROSI|nr:unnamed protein product [Dovyalis caffra]